MLEEVTGTKLLYSDKTRWLQQKSKRVVVWESVIRLDEYIISHNLQSCDKTKCRAVAVGKAGRWSNTDLED